MSKYVTDLSFRHASLGNAILKSIYDLTLVEKRLILLVLSSMDSSKEVNSTDWFSLNIDDYSYLVGATHKNAFEALKEASLTLFDKHITMKGLESPRSLTRFRWVQAIQFLPEEGRVQIQWSEKIVPFISSLQSDFTRVFNGEVIPLKSIYSIRLYLLLDQERFKGIQGLKEIDFQYLLDAWVVPETYHEYKYFKNVILHKAIKELEEANLAYIEIKAEKRLNRKVKSIVFKYTLERRDKKNYITIEG